MTKDELTLHCCFIGICVLLAAMLCQVLFGCAPPKTPTPGGLVVHYSPGEKRLSSEKAAELDARYAAVLECLPPESFCRSEPPNFSINGECDWFLFRGVKLRGYRYLNGTRRIVLPGSLGAAAHEMVHHYTCLGDHPDKAVYKTTLLATCGDTIDAFFRRMYPPPKECPA